MPYIFSGKTAVIECNLGVLNLKSRNSKSYMVPTASITLSVVTYVVFCTAVYAKKFML